MRPLQKILRTLRLISTQGSQSFSQGLQGARISKKNFKKEFQKRISKKNFKKEFQKRISKKNFKKEFQKT